MDQPAPPLPAPSAGPTCPSCRLPLTPSRVRRHGGCLAVLGWPLLLGGALAVAFALLTLVGFLKKAAPTVQTFVHERQAQVIQNLQKIRGLPPSVIEEFRSTGRISEATMHSLPGLQRLAVGANMFSYAVTMGRASEQGKALAAAVTIVCLIVLVVGALAFVLGMVLTAKRRVLSCAACGVVLERAG